MLSIEDDLLNLQDWYLEKEIYCLELLILDSSQYRCHYEAYYSYCADTDNDCDLSFICRCLGVLFDLI